MFCDAGRCNAKRIRVRYHYNYRKDEYVSDYRKDNGELMGQTLQVLDMSLLRDDDPSVSHLCVQLLSKSIVGNVENQKILWNEHLLESYQQAILLIMSSNDPKLVDYWIDLVYNSMVSVENGLMLEFVSWHNTLFKGFLTLPYCVKDLKNQELV